MKINQIILLLIMLCISALPSYGKWNAWKGEYIEYYNFRTPQLVNIINDSEECKERVRYSGSQFEYYISYPADNNYNSLPSQTWTVYEGPVYLGVDGNQFEYFFMDCDFAEISHRLKDNRIEIRYRVRDTDQKSLLFAMKRNPLLRFMYYDIHKDKQVVVNIPLINVTSECKRIGM